MEAEREAEVRELMQLLNVSEERANFIVAIERGEIPGDVLELDDDGKPIGVWLADE